MFALIALSLIITLYIRVYFYELSEGVDGREITIGLFRRIYSIKYLIPIRYLNSDNFKIFQYKKKANIALYCFYVLFCFSLIYSFFIR